MALHSESSDIQTSQLVVGTSLIRSLAMPNCTIAGSGQTGKKHRTAILINRLVNNHSQEHF